MALRVRDHDSWGWLLASGILSVLLGVLIWAQWPASGLWVIGLLVGIQLLFTGWSLVMLALAARRRRHALGTTGGRNLKVGGPAGIADGIRESAGRPPAAAAFRHQRPKNRAGCEPPHRCAAAGPLDRRQA